MKIYIVKGEHFVVPGVPTSAHVTPAAADAAARDLVNLLRADLDQEPMPEGADWREMLRDAQCWRIIETADAETMEQIRAKGDEALAEAAECDVWIEEYDVADVPAPPAAIEALLEAGEGVANLLESVLSTGVGPNGNVYREALAELNSTMQIARWAAVAPAVVTECDSEGEIADEGGAA